MNFNYIHRPLFLSLLCVIQTRKQTYVNPIPSIAVTFSLQLSPAMTQLQPLMQQYAESVVGHNPTLTLRLSFFQSFSVCVAISCGDPSVPPNAVVSGAQSWTYGSVLQYSCVPGGVLVGNSTRHCQEDGTWSGAPPYCTGKSTLFYKSVCLVFLTQQKP